MQQQTRSPGPPIQDLTFGARQGRRRTVQAEPSLGGWDPIPRGQEGHHRHGTTHHLHRVPQYGAWRGENRTIK